MRQWMVLIAACWLLGNSASRQVPGDERRLDVANDAELRRALGSARPGWRIVLAPGKYRPGLYISNLSGTPEEPISIEGSDPKNKPLFEGGSEGLHLGDCAHLVIRNIAFRGQKSNGINIDDGGTFDTPAHHIVLEGLDVSDVGPTGNHDGIKLSGVDDLVVRRCRVEGWGGEAIDMVGCHRGLIEGCVFRGKAGFSQNSGVQAKGGSSDITIRECVFLDAGQRGVNLGGSTSLKVFRPPGARYEARSLTVEGCRFSGGDAPIAFVGVDGAVVRYNTIYRPGRWVLRILQETTEQGFVPCRNGRFERNLVVFSRSQLRSVANVGPATEPGSFVFRGNFWFCQDRPEASRPDLPTREDGSVYGIDPRLSVQPDNVPGAPGAEPARAFGADALLRGGRP